MASKEVLTLLRYEEGALKKYRQFAQTVSDAKIVEALQRIATEKKQQIDELRWLYNNSCKGG